MLSIDKGNLKIEGSKILILAELSTLIFALHDDNFISKNDICHSVIFGLMSEKEIDDIYAKLN